MASQYRQVAHIGRRTERKKSISLGLSCIFIKSITLTPGTVTLDIQDDIFIIHAISDHAAEGLVSSMAQRINNVFAD
mgnify:CR=1 FL=1